MTKSREIAKWRILNKAFSIPYPEQPISAQQKERDIINVTNVQSGARIAGCEVAEGQNALGLNICPRVSTPWFWIISNIVFE